MRFLRASALALALCLVLTACGGRQPDAAATPTPAASPAAPPTAPPTPTPAPPAVNPLTGAEDADYTGVRPLAVTLRTRPGSGPQWGVAAADVLIAGVSEGDTATLMALYAAPQNVAAAGPVGPGRDLTLQFALPLNAVPVHMDKNIYAQNLLNLLAYQDLDGYHVGKYAFAFDADRYTAGYRSEDCWYTSGALAQAGMDFYGASMQGPNQPLFNFGQRPAPAQQNAAVLTVTYSPSDSYTFTYDAAGGLYAMAGADGAPVTDANDGAAAAFTNVFVLYASSGVKSDGYTREYNLSGGTGLYLTAGGWQTVRWSKADAAAPLVLTAEDGTPLVVSPGRSYIAVWGGYYGQALRLTDAAGAEQTLPERPALLEGGVTDEAAAAAEEQYRKEQLIVQARAELANVNRRVVAAKKAAEAAQASEDPNDDDLANLELYNAAVARDEVLARLEELGVDTSQETIPEE